MSKEKSSALSWTVAVIAVLAIVAAGVYVARRAMHAGGQAPASASTAPAPASTAAPPIQHPIEQAASGAAPASSGPLPALAHSDASVAAALAALAGGDELRALLVPQQLIARIVATVDALPRRGMSTDLLPLHAPKGSYAVDLQGGKPVPGAQNGVRYQPYMLVFEEADVGALAAWYVRYYPLFQQAYVELGYPKGYFNDRLIVAIDDLLATPDPKTPPILVQSGPYYVYADPALESLSNGQRLLLRMGSSDEAIVKDKLRSLRSTLTEHAPVR